MIEYPEGENHLTLAWVHPEGYTPVWGMKCQDCNSTCLCIARWKEGDFYRCPMCHKCALWK